jgi:hypothetical protein
MRLNRQNLEFILMAMEDGSTIQIQRGEELLAKIYKYGSSVEGQYELDLSFSNITKQKLNEILDIIYDYCPYGNPPKFKISMSGLNYAEIDIRFNSWIDLLEFGLKLNLFDGIAEVFANGKFKF